jgi:hypothetical protein
MRTTILLCAALFLAGCSKKNPQEAPAPAARHNNDQPIVVSDGNSNLGNQGKTSAAVNPARVRHGNGIQTQPKPDGSYFVKDPGSQVAWLELTQTPRKPIQLKYNSSWQLTFYPKGNPADTLVLKPGDATDEVVIKRPKGNASSTDVQFAGFAFDQVDIELDGVRIMTLPDTQDHPTSPMTVCVHYCKMKDCDLNYLQACTP